jgi:hypothetical protein
MPKIQVAKNIVLFLTAPSLKNVATLLLNENEEK